MRNPDIETIIIGGGIAGLACAHELARHKQNFLLLTENVGGRIEHSKGGAINYGAYFVLDNYKHILPFVKKGERLHPFLIEFHDRKKRAYHLLKLGLHPLQTFRLVSLLLRFKTKYERFKKQCETTSQKNAIESSPELHDLYRQKAENFVKEKGIEQISKTILCEGVYMCTFLPLSKVSAFDFMRLCLGLLIPAYEFVFLKDKLIKNFKRKIVIDSALQFKKNKLYQVQTKTGKIYRAKNLVLATPSTITKKLLGLKKTKLGANAYVFHISGDLKEKWEKGQFELFKSDSSVIFIRRQKDGTYIFYSKKENVNLRNYFINPVVIFKKCWQPAFNITGNELLDCEQIEDLYVIGDHNVIGLEDSYITGLFAANEILKKRATCAS